jgi:hypothetical protein
MTPIRSSLKFVFANKPEKIAQKTLNEVRQQAIDNLQRQADRWISENKLIHAGAARQLAEELKSKLKQ